MEEQAWVPLSAPGRFTPAERAELDEVLHAVVDGGRYVLGPEVDAFEEAFATYVGASACVGVGNGTDAVEIALRAVGVTAGDQVATVANAGGFATAAILAIGAVPRFVDVDDHLLLEVTDLERVLAGGGISAVVLTHLYGAAADADAAWRLASAHGAALVEDCAQAHGLRVGGRHVGTTGDAAAWSFYPTKNLGALGDGGAVTSRRGEVVERARRLRRFGWRAPYDAVEIGRNSRLDELQAAVLRWRLGRLDGDNARRVELAARYRAATPELRWVSPEAPSVRHLCVLRTADRATAQRALADTGVATAIHYPTPDHRQGWFGAAHPDAPHLARTEAAAREVLTVPCFPAMTDGDVDQVLTGLRAIVPATG